MKAVIIKFAPNQKLPPGYTIQWWEENESYQWVIDENTYGMASVDRWYCYRSAWLHHRKHNSRQEQLYPKMELLELKKRADCLIQYPKSYGIECDICGGINLHWSEWEHLIWCYDCEIDTKGTGGIFDGPIPVGSAEVLGISFDRVNIKTGEIIEFKPRG